MKWKFSEAQFQTKFGHWLKRHNQNETYELKIVKEGPFRFNQVKEHQEQGLLKSVGGIYIKIPDSSSKTGHSNKKPFDCLFIKANEAYVAVMFYVPFQRQYFYRIPIRHFLALKDYWPKKSLHEEDFSMQVGVERYYL